MSHLPGSRGFSLQAGVIINLQGLKAWLIGNPSRYIQIEHKVHEKPVGVLSCVCSLDQTCCHHTAAWLKRSNRWTTFSQGGSDNISHPKLPLLLHYYEPWFSCPIKMFWHNCAEEKVSADKAPTHTHHTHAYPANAVRAAQEYGAQETTNSRMTMSAILAIFHSLLILLNLFAESLVPSQLIFVIALSHTKIHPWNHFLFFHSNCICNFG